MRQVNGSIKPVFGKLLQLHSKPAETKKNHKQNSFQHAEWVSEVECL